MKKRITRLFLSVMAAMIMMVGIVMLPSTKVEAATTSQNNIVARANYMWNATWVCQKQVLGWRNNYTFYKGTTYRLPYAWPIYAGGYIGFAVSVEDFLTAAKDASSVFYTKRSNYESYYSTYYGNDCSAFVSYSWGASRHTTATIPQISTYIGIPNTSNNTYNLQLGDALNSNTVGHVVLVTGLTYNSSGAITQIEITEQTPPQLKRSYYTPATLSSKYSGSYKIYRYTKTVPAAPNSTPAALPTQKADHLSDSFIAKITYPASDKVFSIYDENNIYNVKLYTKSDSPAQQWKFEKQSDGTYKITNMKYQQCLAVEGSSANNGANIRLAADDGSKGQRWIVYYLGSENYVIKPTCSTDTVMTVSGGGTSVGTNIEAGTYYANTSQTLGLSAILPTTTADLGESFKAHITFDVGQKNLSIYEENNGYNVKLYDQTESEAQQWLFEKQSDGTYKITNMKYQQCMAVDGGASADGTNVLLAADDGSTAQRWTILDSGTGKYILRPACASSTTAILDVYGGNTETGTNIWIYAYNGSTAQEFSINKIVEETTEAPSEEEPSEETPSEEVPSEETPSEEVPSEEVPSEETPSEEVPSEEIPSEEVPSEETPSEEVSSEETPSEEVPSEEEPSGEAPSDKPEEPSGEAPSDKPEEPGGEVPSDKPEEPSGEAPSDKLEEPSGEAPSDKPEKPSEEQPEEPSEEATEEPSTDDTTDKEEEETEPVVDLKAEAKKLKISGFKQVTYAYGTTAISMSWKKVSGAEGYAVYRATTKNGKYKHLKNVTTNSYRDQGLEAGSKYYYKVRAYKTISGKKVYGPYTVAIRMITKPATPDDFTVVVGAKKSVGIKWKKTGSTNGYIIYVASSRNGSYKILKSTDSLRTSYTKTGLVKGKKYYFKIRSYRTNTDGSKVYSGYSQIKAVTVK